MNRVLLVLMAIAIVGLAFVPTDAFANNNHAVFICDENGPVEGVELKLSMMVGGNWESVIGETDVNGLFLDQVIGHDAAAPHWKISLIDNDWDPVGWNGYHEEDYIPVVHFVEFDVEVAGP